MPVIHNLIVRPVTLTAGSSGVINIVGGDTALSDDTDATYVQCTNLDGITFLDTPPTVQFPGVQLAVGALSSVYLSARYEQVSGASSGYPGLGGIITLGTRTPAAAGDGVVEEDGFWNPSEDLEGYVPAYTDYSLSLFPLDALTPQTFDLGFAHDISAACDFRVYEMALHIQWYVPASTVPARRLYPRTDHVGPGLGRVFPPPNTPQSGARFGSSSPV